MTELLTKFGNYKSWAPFILRVTLGILMMAHGAGKLFGANASFLTQLGIPEQFLSGIAGFAGWIGTPVADGGLGLPAAFFFAWLVALLEFGGGLALILGLFTRLGALLLSLQFFIIIVYVKIIVGNGWEVDLPYLGGLVAILLLGPGPYSLERKIFGKVRF